MSQPPALNRAFSFSNFQAANPSLPIPGSQVDLELNNVVATANAIRTNLALIQRDDGALANASVTYDTLSPALQTAGIAPALPWVTGTAYSVSASVTQGSAFYRCLVAHTSGMFATDLAAGNWVLIVDFATIALVAASLIAVTPSGSLTTDVQTSLQALDTGKAPLSHTQVSSTISDSTAAGRALLTAADAAAQNILLGTASLGFVPGNIKETAGILLESGWYWCDGSNKNRVTDAPLFNAITIQQSGTLTSGSAVITGLSDTSNMSPRHYISGIGVQAGAIIQSVDSSTQITMSATATVTSTTALVIAPFGIGDGSATFTLPNRAYVAVGRDNASGSASNIMQVSTTISVTTGTNAATVGSATGLFVGMYVSQPKIPLGTTISAISGTSVTLSANATGTLSTAAVRFSVVVDAQSIGAITTAGMSQSTTLVTANLPAYTPGGTITNGAISNVVSGGTFAGTGALDGVGTGATIGVQEGANIVVTSTQGASTFAGTAQGGTSTPIIKSIVQPTIVMNFMIKR